MKDRRRRPRYPVSWHVRLSIQGSGAVALRVVDASLHGLRVEVEPGLASTVFRPGQRYRVEVHDSKNEWVFVRVGEVRYIGEHDVGFQTIEPLPQSLLDQVGAAPASRNGGTGDESAVSRASADAAATARSRVFQMARAALRRRLRVVP